MVAQKKRKMSSKRAFAIQEQELVRYTVHLRNHVPDLVFQRGNGSEV